MDFSRIHTGCVARKKKIFGTQVDLTTALGRTRTSSGTTQLTLTELWTVSTIERGCCGTTIWRVTRYSVGEEPSTVCTRVPAKVLGLGYMGWLYANNSYRSRISNVLNYTTADQCIISGLH